MESITQKRCTKCGGIEFDKRRRCKACRGVYNKRWRSENKGRRNEYNRKWNVENRDRKLECNKRWRDKNKERLAAYFREDHLRKAYGLTSEDYDGMFASQGGVCAICGCPPNGKGLSVDHDHETGKIRGLLCTNCNIAIGLLRDSPDLLKTAIEYLQRGLQNVV